MHRSVGGNPWNEQVPAALFAFVGIQDLPASCLILIEVSDARSILFLISTRVSGVFGGTQLRFLQMLIGCFFWEQWLLAPAAKVFVNCLHLSARDLPPDRGPASLGDLEPPPSC